MRQIALKYAAFAAIATLVNVSTQELVLRIIADIDASDYEATLTHIPLYVAILAGTVAGLACKYFLDKYYIFNFVTTTRGENIRHFAAYTMTGIGTTCLFWGFELGFEYIFQSPAARYVGASLGLAIGYGIKYQLDKRYVFISAQDSL